MREEEGEETVTRGDERRREGWGDTNDGGGAGRG